MGAVNEFGQPIGLDLAGWRPPVFPPSETIAGRYVTLAPMEYSDAEAVFRAFEGAPDSLWTYMPSGPYRSVEDVDKWISKALSYPDWRSFVIVLDGVLVGVCSYLRVDPRGGVIEIGSISFSPKLQRTPAATEAIYLMIRNAFGLGYRRCEWKCDDLNAPSRAAALRYGFQFEGIFRNAAHYKGRSRDTAWFSIVDSDWPQLNAAFQAWLDPSNFDETGTQRAPLRHGDRVAQTND